MEHRLLSRQSSCPEATAIHIIILDIPGWVFVFQQNGVPAHRARDTVAFRKRKVLDSFLQRPHGRRSHWILTQSTIYIASVVYCRRKFRPTHPELLTWMN